MKNSWGTLRKELFQKLRNKLYKVLNVSSSTFKSLVRLGQNTSKLYAVAYNKK